MPAGNQNINQLVDHLYRHEAGKLVAVLTGVFGPANMELAEDVVHDSLVEAMKDWPYKGLPNDPSAWLYKVARNKALNILNREKYKRQYAAAYFLPNERRRRAERENMQPFCRHLLVSS
jgi:predicted RNA polymerase sigma factor